MSTRTIVYPFGMRGSFRCPAAPALSSVRARFARRRDLGEDRLGGGARIGREGDRPADDEMVGAVGDRPARGRDALLVAGLGARRPHAGGDEGQGAAEGLAQPQDSDGLATRPSIPAAIACAPRRATSSPTPQA